MAEEEAQVGMLPMVVTPERKEIMASYFTLTLRESDRVAPEKVAAFAAVAISLGLHPLAGELMIIEGRLYVTIDGRRRLAMRNQDFAAIEPSIVTDQATRIAMGATRKGDILAMCRVYRKSTPISSIQYGLVREAERWPSKDKSGGQGGRAWTSAGEQTKLGLTDEQVEAAKKAHDPDSLFDLARDPAAKVRPVLTQPAMMAMKRAEARALSLMASVALPTFDAELGTTLEPDLPPNGNGGELTIEGEGRVIDDEAEEPIDEAPVEETPPAPVEETPPAPVSAEPTEAAAPPAAAETEAAGAGDPMAHTPPAPPAAAAPAPGRRQAPVRAPVGGGLLHPPATREALIRQAVEKLHYRNIAAVLAALGVKDAQEITDCTASWNTLVKLAPAEPSA